MVFSATPNGTLQVAQFMYRIGSIKTEPTSWKDMYFPDIDGFPWRVDVPYSL